MKMCITTVLINNYSRFLLHATRMDETVIWWLQGLAPKADDSGTVYPCTASTQWWGQLTLVQHPHSDEASLPLSSIHTVMRPAYPCPAFTQWWGLLTLVQHPDNDEAILVAGGQLLVMLVPCHNLHRSCSTQSNSNNEYLESLTRTGPKRLHILYKYILSKFSAYNMNARTHMHAHTQTSIRTHVRTHIHIHTHTHTHQQKAKPSTKCTACESNQIHQIIKSHLFLSSWSPLHWQPSLQDECSCLLQFLLPRIK